MFTAGRNVTVCACTNQQGPEPACWVLFSAYTVPFINAVYTLRVHAFSLSLSVSLAHPQK